MQALKNKFLFVHFLIVFLFVSTPMASQGDKNNRKNIAAGKLYDFSKPNHNFSEDYDDIKQLTDGVYSKNYILWKDKRAVGWYGFNPIEVKIDLGGVKAISGFKVYTASGGEKNTVLWGPQIPEEIQVYISDDNANWFYADEIIDRFKTNSEFNPRIYTKIVLSSSDIITYGRYVKFIIKPSLPGYFVADEIEIFEGDTQWIGKVNRGEIINDLSRFHRNYTFKRLIKKQLSSDLNNVRKQLTDFKIPILMQSYSDHLNSLQHEINKISVSPPENFIGISPLNTLHREIFRIQAKIWRQEGFPDIEIWKNNRWAPMRPNEIPVKDSPLEIKFHLGRNEFRSDVINITNTSEEDQSIFLIVDKISEILGLSNIKIFKVLNTVSRRSESVAAALSELLPQNSRYQFIVPSGMTQQIWLQINSKNARNSQCDGNIEIFSSAAQLLTRIPVEINIHNFEMPINKRLNLSGWSNTNIPNFKKPFISVTPENQKKMVQKLQECSVNSPWATWHAMPQGKFGSSEKFIELPTTKNFDEWIALWPNAKRYFIYLRPFRSFHDIQPGNKYFKQRLQTWIDFWKKHIEKRKIDSKQLVLCIIDEPKDSEGCDTAYFWSKEIKERWSNVTIFENPRFKKADECSELIQYTDIMCIYRRAFFKNKKWFLNSVEIAQKKNKELWLYSAQRNSRTVDPYTYYRGQAWHAFKIGAVGSAFWSFSDMREAPIWNEFLSDNAGPYTPLFIGENQVINSKYFEAIREGVQDFEYLFQLKQMVDRHKKDKVKEGYNKKAEGLLTIGVNRVLNFKEKNHYNWFQNRDRFTADDIRKQILELLSND